MLFHLTLSATGRGEVCKSQEGAYCARPSLEALGGVTISSEKLVDGAKIITPDLKSPNSKTGQIPKI